MNKLAFVSRYRLRIVAALYLTSLVLFLLSYKYNTEGSSDYTTYLYFALTSLSTVGYGDVSPNTSTGRIIACLALVALLCAQLVLAV